jgi:hypothetical protein
MIVSALVLPMGDPIDLGEARSNTPDLFGSQRQEAVIRSRIRKLIGTFALLDLQKHGDVRHEPDQQERDGDRHHGRTEFLRQRDAERAQVLWADQRQQEHRRGHRSEICQEALGILLVGCQMARQHLIDVVIAAGAAAFAELLLTVQVDKSQRAGQAPQE